MSNILDEIIAHKRTEVRAKAAGCRSGTLDALCAAARPPMRLGAVLSRSGLSVIAEIKRRSPTSPLYPVAVDVRRLASIYAASGAAAISVIADEKYFGGGAEVVREVGSAVGGRIPVIYKDFIVDPWQVVEARAMSADAVLIIVRAADREILRACIEKAGDLGMDCIVETFTEGDVNDAIAAGAKIIGINNRDLADFRVDPGKALGLKALLPPGTIAVSESGLKSVDDARRALDGGFDAVLVGDAFLAAKDIAATVRAFAECGKGPRGKQERHA
jgi:indole-3-glycerol phosphate synthase